MNTVLLEKLQIKRGNKQNLPTLSPGEFGFCADSNELFIGNTDGNVLISESTEINLIETSVYTVSKDDIFKNNIIIGSNETVSIYIPENINQPIGSSFKFINNSPSVIVIVAGSEEVVIFGGVVYRQKGNFSILKTGENNWMTVGAFTDEKYFIRDNVPYVYFENFFIEWKNSNAGNAPYIDDVYLIDGNGYGIDHNAINIAFGNSASDIQINIPNKINNKTVFLGAAYSQTASSPFFNSRFKKVVFENGIIMGPSVNNGAIELGWGYTNMFYGASKLRHVIGLPSITNEYTNVLFRNSAINMFPNLNIVSFSGFGNKLDNLESYSGMFRGTSSYDSSNEGRQLLVDKINISGEVNFASIFSETWKNFNLGDIFNVAQDVEFSNVHGAFTLGNGMVANIDLSVLNGNINLSENCSSASEIFKNHFNCEIFPNIRGGNPAGVRIAGAFNECRSMVNAPEIVCNIYDTARMFYNCTNLVNYKETENELLLKGYCINMFENCTNLTGIPKNITLDSGSPSGLFFNCTNLSVEFENVNIIGVTGGEVRSMFQNCSNIINFGNINFWVNDTGVNINIVDIFNGCTNLTSVKNITGSRLIAINVFGNCNKLESVDTLKNITTMPNMFRNLSNFVTLNRVDLSEYGISPAFINLPNAFLNCYNFIGINSFDGMANILQMSVLMDSAFSNCISLINAPVVVGGVSANFAFFNCQNLVNANLAFSQSPLLNQIQNGFANCVNLSGNITFSSNRVVVNGGFRNTFLNSESNKNVYVPTLGHNATWNTHQSAIVSNAYNISGKNGVTVIPF